MPVFAINKTLAAIQSLSQSGTQENADMVAGLIGVKIAMGKNDNRITPDIAGNMRSGDIVATTDGKEYITIGARHDWLEVAPIINGKSQVNAESAFKFLLSPEKAGAYPERKNEPVYRTGRNYYDEQSTKGKNNAPNTQSGMERNSQSANGQPVGATGVSSTGGGDGRGTGSDNGGTGNEGSPVGSTNDLFNGSATIGGAGSDSQVYASEPSISGRIAERGGRGRSGDDSVNGEITERTTAGAVSSTTTTTALIRQKIKAQADVEHIPVATGDIDNIRQTLPFLQAEQQDDVHKTEQRFEQGHGMLFTNGTGTGKTYSGLGVIKRFHKQGKDNILIVVPSQDIMKDWIKSGANLGLAITALESTTEAGEGIVITTYANLAANQHLADRNWDLVVADESHKLMTNEAGEPTEALNAFRAITNHPSGLNKRARMALRDLHDEINRLEATIKDNRTSDNENQWFANNALEPKLEGLHIEFDAKQKALVEQYKGQPRTKAVMLSATPFAYVKNVDYAEGYLFEYGDDRGDAYNSGDGREKFFMQHFGYRMRYNKLTQPDANVNSEVMERTFNDYLKNTGALSGRRLNIDQDYERSFALVDDAIGEKIDEGLEWLRTANDSRYAPIYEAIMKKFDYLARLRLLEALKARHAVKTIKKCLALGRKIVVFHDYNEGGNLSNPFKNITFKQEQYTTKSGESVSGRVLLAEAADLRPDIFNLDIEGIASPINTIKENFPTALIYNGTIANKDRTEAKRLFNDDNSGNDIIVVQSAAGEAGISLHDTTGQKQRILLNLGMPTRPTTAIQQEGRIYRVGQKTDAIFKYMNTGTTWERQTFATKISERASTVENLALGDEARALKQAFIDAYQNSDYYEPSEGEGKGGKEADKAENSSISPFERAISFYYAQQKNSKSRANREGKDYYATPEPVGFKMVEFGGVKSGDKLLEPSAGHGAIARFFPEQNARTLVEQSPDLASRATLASTGSKVITGSFESLHITNKYDVIVMNPPYGSGGKTAIEHVTKAATHLRNGGRIVALIPEGQANKRLADLMSSEAGKDLYQVADIHLPSSTFERAGTGVMTHIVVLEKQTDKEVAEKIRGRNIDISNAENVKELFSRLENISLPARLEPLTKEVEPLLKGEKVTVGGIGFQVEDDESMVVSLDGRIEKSQFSYLARLAPKYGGILDTEYRKTLFSFASAQHLTAFLDAIEKGEEVQPISSTKVETSGIDILKAGEFTHSKKGTPVYAASITARVDKDVYNSLKEKAGEFDGYYSSFNKMGAIAGFHFPTKEKRDAFISAVQGAKDEAGFDSLNSGVSLMDTLALITSLSKKKDESVAQQLAVAIGVRIEKPLQPIKNSAGEVSTSNGLELKIAIPDKWKSAGIKSLSNIRFMIDPVVGEALTANTNTGQPVKIQLSDKPELKALWENYSAIKSNNDAQAQKVIQAKKEAALALDQVEIDKMNQQAKELMTKIPEGGIPVDFVSNTEYSVHGISLSWHDVVVIGHASAIRKGALGSFKDVTVAYITPEKLAEVKARKDKIRDQLIAEKKDLLTAVVPKSAMDLYKKYRGSAENAWSAGDDGAWAAINAWSPYIEAQASGVQIEKPSPTDFNLSTYTEADLRAQEAVLKAAEVKRQADEKAAKDKAIADKQVGDFRLSGSSMPSDVAASYGQNDMFVQTRGQTNPVDRTDELFKLAKADLILNKKILVSAKNNSIGNFADYIFDSIVTDKIVDHVYAYSDAVNSLLNDKSKLKAFSDKLAKEVKSYADGIELQADPVVEPVAVQKHTVVDFPIDDAIRGWYHSARSPEALARSWAQSYDETIKEAYDLAVPFAETDKQKEILEAKNLELQHEYIARFKRYARSREGVTSSFIAGGSKFNHKQANRRGDASDKVGAEFEKWVSSIKDSIKYAVTAARNSEQLAAIKAESDAKIKAAQDKNDIFLSRLLAFKKGDYFKIGSGSLVRVNKNKDGLPTTITVSAGNGIIKGLNDKISLVGERMMYKTIDDLSSAFARVSKNKDTQQYDDLGGFTFTPAIALNSTLDAIMALAKNNSQANAERLSQLLGVKLAPKQELDMFGDSIQHQELDMFGDPIQTESPIQELPRLAIEELPLGNITLSDDVPQFKSGADDDTGVVEPLGGKFDRTGVAPIQVWRRLDGRLEVISGRHRLDLATRSGEKTIPAQVHDEADGFDAKKAGMLDAELNIRDGQGKVRDYVDYFTHSGVTKEQADERGLLARSIGQRAFAIASQGSEELLTLHRNEIISDQAAADVATLAPSNSAMQAVGLRVLQEHKPLNNALNTMRAVMALTREKGQEPDTFDLFGFDDSALKEAEAMAKIASRKQRQINEQLTAIKGAVKNPKAAAKHGVIVENQADALEKVKTMTTLKSRWDNWSSHADLLAEVRQEIAEKGGYDSILDDDCFDEYDSLAVPSMTDYDVVDVDTDEIKLNPTAYQWRNNVTGDGTEKGRVVSGAFNYDDQPPLILHRRLSGRVYLADGHHRYKLAKASHAPIVKAIILDEHDGYTVPAMRVLCGFLNLRKEALVKDRVNLPMVNMAKTADLVRKAVEAEMGW